MVVDSPNSPKKALGLRKQSGRTVREPPMCIRGEIIKNGESAQHFVGNLVGAFVLAAT